MADRPVTTNLPADLPENWQVNQIVSPNGTEAGLDEQHGFNYLGKMLNKAHAAINAINSAFDGVAALSHTHIRSQITDFPTSMTPTAHKSTHAIGGTDELKSTDLGIDALTAAKYFASVVGTENVDQVLSLLGGGNLRRYTVNSSSELDTLLTTLITAQPPDSKKSYVIFMNVAFTPFNGSTWTLSIHKYNVNTYAEIEMISYSKYSTDLGAVAFCRSLVDGSFSGWAKVLNTGNGGAQIATASYTGTGTYGSENPNHLTFSSAPIDLQIVFLHNGVYQGSDYSGNCSMTSLLLTAIPNDNAYHEVNIPSATNVSDRTIFVKKTIDGKTISWYSSDAYKQCNVSIFTYYYRATI